MNRLVSRLSESEHPQSACTVNAGSRWDECGMEGVIVCLEVEEMVLVLLCIGIFTSYAFIDSDS